LLDEPTNHLDLPAIEWLEGELAGLSAAIILISHDRRFLEALTRSTVWIDRGKTRVLNKGFKYFEAWRDEVLEQEELDRHKLDRQIVREERWMHGGVTARRKRNVRRVGELARMRQERKEAIRQTGKVAMAASEAQMSGKLVLEATGIAKAFDGNVVVDAFDLRVGRGDRIGLIGPNGAGKTTLLKLLMGEMQADSGQVRLGSNLEIVTLDQSREQLDPEETLTDALTGGRGDTLTINGQPRHVASYMKDFLFLPEQIRSPLKVLSGGERARVLLARALAKPSNLLVLDEPTNDLDIETLDLLQELISEYAGTVLLVSHDRDFLDRTVTSVIMAEGQGRWIEYAGGYSDMLAQRGRGITAAQSKTSGQAAAGETDKTSSTAAASPRKQNKLSFKDKHALESLPDRMSELTNEAAKLEAELADAALFTSNPDRFSKVTERLSAVQAELEAAEEQWLELEIKREQLEG
ncbi:MAG: ATP-binding cassette domain-containing protein, partial [Pseudomonadota bacterium]